MRSHPGRPLHRGAAHPGRGGARRCREAPRSSTRRISGRSSMLADIFPGARVLEAGVGSRRPVDDAAAGRGRHRRLRAAAGLRQPGPDQRGRLPRRGGARPLPGRGPRRLRRDRRGRPRPHRARPARALAGRQARRERPCAPAGILVSYLPSIVQVAHLREALDHSGFGMDETIEVLQRSWHVEGQSVRPDHRMVAHTGFLTVGPVADGRPTDADEPAPADPREPARPDHRGRRRRWPPSVATGWASWPGWRRGSAWPSGCTSPPGSCPAS